MAAPLPIQQVPRFNPQQQNLLGQVGQSASGLLNKPQSFDFAPIAQQARTQFQTQTIPGLAERFASLGTARSGAFRHAMEQAGAGLEQGLASLQSQYGLQQQGQQNQLLNMLLGYGLSPSFENVHAPEGLGFFESLAPALGQAAGQYGSSYLQNSNQPMEQGEQSSIWSKLLRYLPALIGAAGGAFLGGPGGAIGGFQAGNSVGNLFSGSR